MRVGVVGYIGLLLVSLTLTGCSDWFSPKGPPRTKASKQVKTDYKSDAFIQHLALARLGGGADNANMDVLEAYMAQKPQKLKRQAVLILTYKTSDGERQEVVAPISTKPYTAEFPALLDVMNKLGTSATLQDVHTATTSIVPTDAFKSTDNDQLRIALEQQHQWLMNNAEALPPLDDAQAQLQLIGFFIEYRFRDAAYLSVDNVKRLLASATQQKPVDKDRIRILSKKLETLENLLHKNIPYTL